MAEKHRGPLLPMGLLAISLALFGVAEAAAPHVRVDVDADVALDAAPATAPPKTAELPPLASPTEADALLEPIFALDVGAGAAGVHVSTTTGAPASARSPSAGAAAAAGAEALVRSVPEPVREAAPPALAAVGVLSLAQAFGAWRGLALGGVALYSRLTRSELLDNEHRDRVYKLVQESPGIGMTDIGARLGLGWGTVVYHLDRLEKAGFIATERNGARRCCFPVGTLARESRAAVGALQTDAAKALALYVAANPGASQSQVCDALGLSASAASKQVSKLEGAGLIRRERDWKTVHLYPAAELPGLLDARATTAGAAPALAV